MATFQRGVQDQLQAIRPPDNLMQFNAQVLTAGQSQYDKSHAQLSKMYGTILNAGLTREDNILAREEFFKLIHQDLHKIAGMDLSKDSNVTQAKNVFKQIYTNKPLVKDMVWTKNYQDEMQRAEGFRNCIDPEKCGGQYWEDGVKYMQYKREEFKNANRDESMMMGDVRYISYNNMMEDAIKAFKDVEHEVKIEKVQGRYQITTKGGQNSIKPLTMLFSKLYANNPQYADQFKVLAYNGRKDWIYNAVSKGDYESLEEASVGYIQKHRDDFEQRFNETAKDIDHDHQQLTLLAEAYQKDKAEGRIEAGSEEDMEGAAAVELLKASTQLQSYNDMVKRAQKSMYNQTDINRISGFLDELNAASILTDEINGVAQTLAMQQVSVEYEEDKFALADQRFQHDVALEGIRHKNKMDQIALENDAKASEFRYQAMVEAGNYREYRDQLQGLEENMKANVVGSIQGITQEKASNILRQIDQWDGDLSTDAGQKSMVKAITDADETITASEAEKALEAYQGKLLKAQSNMNDAAIKALYQEGKGGIEGNTYDINTSILSDNQLNTIATFYNNDPDNTGITSLILQIAESGQHDETMSELFPEFATED